MPYTGHGGAHGGCACHQSHDADAHLINDADGRAEMHQWAYGAQVRGATTVFCPGANVPQYAPDLLLEPTHLDITLHVDLEQQCLVVDEVITVCCHIPSKSNVYSIDLDGIGFQHLHASRLSSTTPLNSQPTSPRRTPSPSSKVSLDLSENMSSSRESRDIPSRESRDSKGLLGLLRQAEKKLTPFSGKSKDSSSSSTSTSTSSSASSSGAGATIPGQLEEARDSTAFYCTYDGRKITLSWVGAEAFSGGTPGAVEKVRLIYLVEKPITGLYFTKPPSEMELESLEQQQKPLVTSSYAAPNSDANGASSAGKSNLTTSATRLSPFHASRPLLACTDHETERARYWLATIDQPNVRPTAKYTFIVKAGLTAIANGELIPTMLAPEPAAVPVWPLSLFNPPIAYPKPPTYGRAIFVWNNPYPTASYVVGWAVGQLHYVEAIPPRSSSSGSSSRLSISGVPGPSSSISAPFKSSRHKRTQSSDSTLTSSTNSASSKEKERSPNSSTIEDNISPRYELKLSAISESLESSTASEASSRNNALGSGAGGASHFSPTNTSSISLAFPLLESNPSHDASHHKKSSRRREDAEWVIRDIPMRYYTPRNVPLTTVQLMLNRTPEIMRWLQGRLGMPFPFPLKYYQFVAPELPSAMENITLTTWGSDYLLNPVWALEYGESTESINVHEMAHSYFGNSIGCKFWDHAWLKEGWANYVECLWQEDKYGADALAYMLWRNGRLYMKESDNLYARPIVTNVYDSSWDLYDQHLYRGGSRRIHSLRCLLGDAIFFPAVTDYLRTYQGKLVETDDFRKVLEKHSHRNLAQFFNQWLYSPGYPQITASYEYSPTRQQIIIEAKQTQMNAQKGIGVFSMSIPIDIAYVAPSSDSAATTAAESASLTPSIASSTNPSASGSGSSKVRWMKTALVFSEGSPDAHLTVHLPSPPLQIIFDKKLSYLFTLKMDPGFTVLRTMALHCWSVPHRIWAAQCLLELGSPQEISVISEMLLHREEHWGVIADVAMLLARSHHAHQAAGILCKLLLTPPTHPAQHPKALMSVALALGEIKDPRIQTAIRQYLALKKYTNVQSVDENALRTISSWSSLTALAESARAAGPPPKEKKSVQDAAATAMLEGETRTSLDGKNGSSSAKKEETSTSGGDNVIPYKTLGRLLESLAAQGDPNDEPLILEQAERARYGWLGITRGSALMALSRYGTTSAFDYIMSATIVSEHQHLKARSTALAALAECVIQSKMSTPLLSRALHTLHLLLHDPTYLIRFSAVHALFKLIPQMNPQAAQESLSYIQHIRKTLSNQDREWVKRKRLLIRGEGGQRQPLPQSPSRIGQSPPPSSHLQHSQQQQQSQQMLFQPQQMAQQQGHQAFIPMQFVAPGFASAAVPSMDEFLALKSQMTALKARVEQIEKQLEEEDSAGED